MDINKAVSIINAGITWEGWSDEKLDAMKLALQSLHFKQVVTTPHPIEKWHEDDGCVIWWKLPVCEPPYVGTPLDTDFNEDYYTHFTFLAEPIDS